MRHRRWTIVTLLACVLVTSACSKNEPPPPPAKPAAPPPQAAAPPQPAAVPFRVVSVDLGKQVTADKKIAEPTTKVAPGDTIYAVVASEGGAEGVALKARWTYGEGQLVNESSQTITPTGPASTEFHIAKPSGWPAGTYKVEIAANDKVVTAKQFTVD